MRVQAIKTVGEEFAQYANRSVRNVYEAVNYLLPGTMLKNGELTKKGADILELSLKTAELPKNTSITSFIKFIRNKAEAIQIKKTIAQETNSAELATETDKIMASLPESIQTIVRDFDAKKMEFSRLLFR